MIGFTFGLLIAAVSLLTIPWLALFFAALALIAAWEWSNLAAYTQWWTRILYVGVYALVMLGLYGYCRLGVEPVLARVQPFLGLACLWWAIALLWMKSYPASAPLWGTPAMLRTNRVNRDRVT